MNTDYFYPLILCFASGFTQCMLLACSVRLFRIRPRHQFQQTFAVVLLMLSFGFFNNFLVSVFRSSPAVEFINTLLLLYDYVVVGGFMAFIVSLVFPGRFSDTRLSLFLVPYVVAILFFAFTRSPWVYPAIQLFTLAVSTALLVWLELSIKSYRRMLRENVSNIDFFDLRWGAAIIALLYFVQLGWSVESLSQQNWYTVSSANNNLIFDTFWCFFTIAYVLFILRKIMHQEVFTAPVQEPTEKEEKSSDYYKTLKKTSVDELVKEKKYYLDPSLTLQKLATLLGTNRQYLSNYINREKGKTFYEYINDFRMDEAKNLLDNWDDRHHHSMDEIATLSGFNTYSTFLRTFVKKNGESPSTYLKRTK